MDTDRPLNKVIRLNVGGSVYSTTLDTLTKSDSMLSAMFSGKTKTGLLDGEGIPFIDRNPRAFFYVLEYLRTGTKCKPPYHDTTQGEIDAEFQFFGLMEGTIEQPVPNKKRRKGDDIRRVFWYPKLVIAMKAALYGCKKAEYPADLSINESGISLALAGTHLSVYDRKLDLPAILGVIVPPDSREELMKALLDDLNLSGIKIGPPSDGPNGGVIWMTLDTRDKPEGFR